MEERRSGGEEKEEEEKGMAICRPEFARCLFAYSCCGNVECPRRAHGCAPSSALARGADRTVGRASPSGVVARRRWRA
eukprot:3578041-Pyramimonas_sp.AAC.1